jgi:hypothetical protein
VTLTARRTILYVVIVALAGAVLCVAFTAIASAEDCTGPQCCACEPAGAAEPAPLPRLYLPTVQRSMPAMSAEFTPAQPVPTPEPDVELPLGDASQ